MRKKSLLLGIAIVLCLGLGTTPESKAEQKKQPGKAVPEEQPRMTGTLVFGLGKEFANPNPFIATSSTFPFVKETVYESLLTQDDGDRIVPNLAEAFEISSGGVPLCRNVGERAGLWSASGPELF